MATSMIKSFRKTMQPLLSIILLLSFLGGLIVNMQYVAWELFALSAFGISMAVLGIISSLGELAYCLMHPVTGRLSDKKGRRVILVLSSIFFILGSSLLAVSLNLILLIPAIVVFRMGSSLFDPGFYASVDESNLIARRARGFGVSFAMRLLGGVSAGILAGLIGSSLGYPILFSVIGALSVFLLITVLAFNLQKNNLVKDRQASEADISPEQSEKDRKIRLRVYLTGAADAFSWSIFYPIFSGMLNLYFNFSLLQIGFMTSLQLLVMFIMPPLFGMLSDKYGRKLTFLISEVLGAFTIFGFMISTDFIQFLMLQIPMAAVGASFIVSIYPLLMDYASIKHKAEVIGWSTAIRGVIAFPAPLIGGLIFDSLGYQYTMLTSLLLVIITIIIMILLLPGGKSVSN